MTRQQDWMRLSPLFPVQPERMVLLQPPDFVTGIRGLKAIEKEIAIHMSGKRAEDEVAHSLTFVDRPFFRDFRNVYVADQ